MIFSERIEVTPVKVDIQTDGIDKDLRTSIWNALCYLVFDKEYEIEESYFWEKFWVFFLKERIDHKPNNPNEIKNILSEMFFNGEWWWVYNFIEFLVKNFEQVFEIKNRLNIILEDGRSGYRFIDNVLCPIVQKVEIEEIEKAANDDQFNGASFHIQEALRMLSDRKNPDFRNSIKESISAVESIAKKITGNEKATLGEAIAGLEKNKKLHSGLKKGFEGLYGYTNDKENGIRHALLDDKAEITLADAQYFLVSCSAFVNYLKTLSAEK